MQKFKKIHDSGTTTLIISYKEMDDIIKIFQAREDSNILLEEVTKKIKNETKGKRSQFVRKHVNRKRSKNGKPITNGKRMLRYGYGSKMDF